MPNKIRITRKTTTGIPSLAQLAIGEGCINTFDNTLHYKKDAGTILTFQLAADILSSAALTGSPTAPTVASNTNNTQIATTAFVKAVIAALSIGSGDMAKSTYDTTDNGNVDLSDNALLLGGQNAAYFTGYTDNAIAALVGGSPSTLNALNELAAAIGNDPNFASSMATLIGTKLDENSTIDGGEIS